MSKYITALDVSLNTTEEQALKNLGFIKINVDLNTGAGGKNIYLWYKKGDASPITRIQVTFNREMENGLTRANYTKISKDLNAGTKGGLLYMWFCRATEEHDVPIVDIAVTTDAPNEAEKLGKDGVWEQVSCNLNLGAGGNWVYTWVKRAKPIYLYEVIATDTYDGDVTLFSNGFTRVDVNTNTGAKGSEVFIWYRKTTDVSKSLSFLQISITDKQYDNLGKQGYELVNVNLNENTTGKAVYLWHKKEGAINIKAMAILLNMDAVEIYGQAGVRVIERSLNEGNEGPTIYLCYK